MSEHSQNAKGESVAGYLVRYLLQLGVKRIFTVPGDYTLLLMQEIERIAGDRIQFILSLNELNGGYSSDGYSRTTGLSVLLITFGVGTLSAFNAVAGMFCEHIPCLVIGGGVNTNSGPDGEVVHHTLGEPARYDFSKRMAESVTVMASALTRGIDFPALLQESFEACFTHRRPVYLEIPCNLPTQSVLAPGSNTNIPSVPLPSPRSLLEGTKKSDSVMLNAAVEAAVKLLNSAARPLIYGGGLMHSLELLPPVADTKTEEKASDNAVSEVLALLERSGFAYASMFDGKAIISEDHPNFVGLYAGGAAILPGTTAVAAEMLVEATVASSDCVLLIGAIYSDYATGGHTFKLPAFSHRIDVNPASVAVGGHLYHHVYMKDFVHALAHSAQLKKNGTLVKEFRTKLPTISGENDLELLKQLFKHPEVQAKVLERATKYPLNLTPSVQLTQRNVVHILQEWFSAGNAATDPLAPTHILADSGDSLISGLKLKIPKYGSYAVQLLYGSLGWASSAAVGYAMGLKDSNQRGRLVVMQGDGGFQMGTQEWSTMMRYGLDIVVLLLNNKNYLVENEIVPGAFNDLVEWDYVQLAQALKDRDGKSKLHAVRARTNEQLSKALQEVNRLHGMCVIEICVAKDDCNFELTQWAHSIAPAASRPPRA